MVSAEGGGQEIIGTAIDHAGRQATDTVTVNLDLTAPTVVLTSPVASTTSNSSIEVAGEVSDALSGIAGVTCNGQAASVVSGMVSCTVTLGPGRNDVMLAARDVAGNMTSKSVRVVRVGTATAIGLTPTARTLLSGETTSLTLTDEFGSVVSGATWSSTDPAILAVSTDDPPVLTALQPGTSTINVTKNGLTAEASLTVVAGTTLTYGTTRWSMSGAPGYGVLKSIVSNRVDLSVPDLFSVEGAGSSIIVRGVTSGGDVLWTASAPGQPLMGDSFGGLVAAANPSVDIYGDHATSLIRFAGPDGSSGWRYDSSGKVSRPAQAADGTIFTVERYSIGVNADGTPILETQVLVLDGATGAVRARYPLAPERRGACVWPATGWNKSPRTLGPVAGTDGYGYLLVRRWTDVRGNPCSITLSQDVGIDLLRVSPLGNVTTTSIYSQHCSSGPPTVCDEPPQLKEIFPDGIDGTLVRAFIYTSATSQGYSGEMRLARVANGAVQFNNVVDIDERTTLIDGTGMAYFVGDDLRKVDVTTGTATWTKSNSTLEPVVPLRNNEVAMHDLSTGMLEVLDSTGTLVDAAAFGGRWGYQSGFGLWTEVSSTTGTLSARFSLPLNEAPNSFIFLGAIGTQQNAPRDRFSAKTREQAAIDALGYIFTEPLASGAAKFEYGGLICKDGQQFRWSEIRTDKLQEEVTVPDTLCPPGTIAAHFHTHPPLESPVPSGNDRSDLNPPQPLGGDYNNARTHPGIPYYLRAPIPNSPVNPPKDTHVLKYWWTGTGSLPSQNVCKRSADGSWAPYTELSPNANCATPNP
jgi:hypothetical protein